MIINSKNKRENFANKVQKKTILQLTTKQLRINGRAQRGQQ